MLAPVSKGRRDGRTSFKSLGKYLTEEIDRDTGEIIDRGEVMTSDALLSRETAVAEMWAVAKENSRCKDPILHFELSWPSDEKPTREQWEDSVKHAMESVGLKDHQYLAVAHKDTDNFHVHIMANRVHPETYRAHSPEWLHKTLDKACRELEAKHGWKQDNGLYKWDQEKGQAVPTTREEREQMRQAAERRGLEKGEAGTGRASQMEKFGNAESLQTYCKGAPSQELAALMKREGVTWQDVHNAMEKHGLALNKGEKGGYTVTAEGQGVKVKASDVFRRQFAGKATREATEAKLGPWEPKRQAKEQAAPERIYNPNREPKRDPAERAERREARAAQRAELRQRYQEYKAQQYAEQAERRPQERATARERFAELAREARERRAAIRTADMSPTERKAARSVAAAEAAQAKAELRAELAEQRKEGRPQSYRDWVAARAAEGDTAAIRQLRGFQYGDARRQQEEARDLASIKSTDRDRDDPADPRKMKEKAAVTTMTWSVDTKTGDVAYQVDGRQAFTDRGERLTIEDQQRRSLEAALRVAQEKYGDSLTLKGTDDFKRQAVEVSVKAGLKIDFNDEQLNRYAKELDDQRQAGREYMAQQRDGAGRPDADKTPKTEPEREQAERDRQRQAERENDGQDHGL